MADMQGDAERFFAQIEGMSGAQLAERGRIARMQHFVSIVGAVIGPVLYTVLFVCVWVPSLPSRLAQDN